MDSITRLDEPLSYGSRVRRRLATTQALFGRLSSWAKHSSIQAFRRRCDECDACQFWFLRSHLQVWFAGRRHSELERQPTRNVVNILPGWRLFQKSSSKEV